MQIKAGSPAVLHSHAFQHGETLVLQTRVERDALVDEARRDRVERRHHRSERTQAIRTRLVRQLQHPFLSGSATQKELDYASIAPRQANVQGRHFAV